MTIASQRDPNKLARDARGADSAKGTIIDDLDCSRGGRARGLGLGSGSVVERLGIAIPLAF
jgi:hypothetical protein